MKNVSPYRILGRASAVKHHLLEKYQLAAADPSADTIMVLLALAQRVYGNDKNICQNIAGAAQLCRTQIENLRLPESENRDEFFAGETEALFIMRKYSSDCASSIVEDHDFIPEIQADKEAKIRRNKRFKRIALGVLGAVVLAVAVYNLPYFAEKRAFADVEKTIAEGSYYAYDDAVEHYFYQYPDGKHIEEVHLLPIHSCRDLDKPVYTVKAAEKYLNRFPDGKYADEVTAIYNEIWNDEIARFNELAATNATEEGAAFVRSMLEYMKEKRISTVAVTGHPTLNLKEYSEYPLFIREYIQSQFDSELQFEPVAVKDKIIETVAKSWTQIIIQALQNGFNRITSEGFITFVDKREAAPVSPEVNVDYTVSTQEWTDGIFTYPDIWIHTSKLNGLTMSTDYFLGIAMNFDARFTLPDTDIAYCIQGQGDPGSEDIEGERYNAYNIMCERCTERFSEKIAAEFGI